MAAEATNSMEGVLLFISSIQQVSNARRIIQLFLLALSAVVAGEVNGQGFLIRTVRTGMVFDHAGQNLYISDGDGLIKTFNLRTHTLQRNYNLGGWVWGIDIAPDDSFILAAQNSVGTSQGTFQRVNLATGTITNINYTFQWPLERGGWDVAIGSNGLALVTTQFSGSGWIPLRQIDLSTNAITIRSDAPGSGLNGQVRGNSQIHRSADGTRLLVMESDISGGETFTYSGITNTFGPSFMTNAFRDFAGGAVDRNGNLVAETTTTGSSEIASLFTAPGFDNIHNFNGNRLDGGLAFDGVRDVLYAVNTATDQIIAYSTITFAELLRFDIGEHIGPPPITQYDTGTLVASADGRWLALETDSGIRLFPIPPGWSIVSIADLNHDGKPDYVLLNAATRQTAVWYLNDNVFVSAAGGPTLPATWRIVDFGDFDGDGKPDAVLLNASTGETAIVYLNDFGSVGVAPGPTLPAGYSLAGTADFNGDGKPDYALFNDSTVKGLTVIWYLNNNSFVSAASGPFLPADYSLAGTADFNGDGKPDYVLLNAATGQTAVWYLNDNVFVSAAGGPTLPAAWSIVDFGDFNGDGKPDAVLLNASTGETAIVYLNDIGFVGVALGPTLPADSSLLKP
jgi:FG-GAP-like repeat